MQKRHGPWRLISVVLLLGGTLAAMVINEHRPADFLAQPLDTIAPQIAGWTQVETQELAPRVLSKLLPTSYLSRSYQKGRQQLGLFIAYYAQQRAGESMHSPKNCLPGSGWQIWQQQTAVVPVPGEPVTVNRFSIQNSGERMIVLYWYQSRDRIVASEYMGKILLVRDALLDGRTAGSLVRITLPDTPETARDGIQFAAALIPQVQRCFGK